jgi:hypothetical protein
MKISKSVLVEAVELNFCMNMLYYFKFKTYKVLDYCEIRLKLKS